ncbi:MAG: fibronectin type III domain-containing protein [Candidatus Paceibacterota bacterium]
MKKLGFLVLALSLVLVLSSVVSAAGLVATITSPTAGATYSVGQTINLSATSASAVGAVNYIWSFSDGTTSRTGQTQAVAFTTAGAKTITLMAGDASGANSTKTVGVTINAVASNRPVISNIATSNITQTGVTITWTTDIPASSRVIYDSTSHADITGATAPNFGYVASTPETDVETKVTSHSVTISGLSPATKYYFRVLSQG